jgi:Autotransporter beta-domain
LVAAAAAAVTPGPLALSAGILTATEDFGTLTVVANDTEIVDFEIVTNDDGSVSLAWTVDFSPTAGAFNANQSAVANYLVETIATGEPQDLTEVLNAVLEAPDAATLANYYDQLSAEPYLQTEQAVVLSAQQFGRGLYECPDTAVQINDKGCGWLAFGGQKTSQSSEFENPGYDESVFEMQMGIGGSLSEQINVLFGISYAQTYLDTEDLASSDGNRTQAGIGLSFENDSGTVLSLAAIGGYATTDVERYQTLTGEEVTAAGNQQLYFGGGQARLLQKISFGNVSLEPELGAWAGYIRHTAIRETGAGATNLEVEAGGNMYASIRPAFSVATEFGGFQGSRFRPYVGGGATIAVTKDGLSRTDLTANLQGDDNLAPAFTVSRSLENPYFDAQLGLDWVNNTGVTFRLGGVAQVASNYRAYGGSMRLVAPF